MAGQMFPQGDEALRGWLLAFVANETAVAALGLPITFFVALNGLVATYGTSLDSHNTSQAQAQGATATKDQSQVNVIDELRSVVAQLRADPDFTNTMAEALGLAAYDTISTPISAPPVAPELEMAVAGPQQVTIHFWDPDNPAPGRRGKPAGARSCRLIHAIVPVGTAAPAASAMGFLADDTNTPNNPNFEAVDIGNTLWVRGAWVSPTGALGPFSEPSSITIPG